MGSHYFKKRDIMKEGLAKLPAAASKTLSYIKPTKFFDVFKFFWVNAVQIQV
jgi:hypothetical protein